MTGLQRYGHAGKDWNILPQGDVTRAVQPNAFRVNVAHGWNVASGQRGKWCLSDLVPYLTAAVLWCEAGLSHFPAASCKGGNTGSPPNIDGHGKFRSCTQKVLDKSCSKSKAAISRQLHLELSNNYHSFLLSFFLITTLRCFFPPKTYFLLFSPLLYWPWLSAEFHSGSDILS